MDQEAASKLVLDTLASQVVRTARGMGERVVQGNVPKNPLTGKPAMPELERVHEKLKAAGLLDDAEFTSDLTALLTQTGEQCIWPALTWHDGSWGSDEGKQLHLSIKGGVDLHDYLHELWRGSVHKMLLKPAE